MANPPVPIESYSEKQHLSPEWALDKLRTETDDNWIELFRKNGVQIEVYKPVGHDPQQPHWCDEVYAVISGEGNFRNGEEKHPFKAGDLMFVPAGVKHRFEDFSDDFATWVIFFGSPDGA